MPGPGGRSPGGRRRAADGYGGTTGHGRAYARNTVQGNLLGTDATGTTTTGTDGTALGNGTGLFITGGNNLIGGCTAGAGNVIAGSNPAVAGLGDNGFGLVLYGGGCGDNVVQGNWIGTNADGATGLGNGAGGVAISYGAHTNTIGGTTAGAGNTIADNGGDGIFIGGEYAPNGNAILGNAIVHNAGNGVTVDSADNTVGGTAAGAGNVIAGTSGDGVFVGNVPTVSPSSAIPSTPAAAWEFTWIAPRR